RVVRGETAVTRRAANATLPILSLIMFSLFLMAAVGFRQSEGDFQIGYAFFCYLVISAKPVHRLRSSPVRQPKLSSRAYAKKVSSSRFECSRPTGIIIIPN